MSMNNTAAKTGIGSVNSFYKDTVGNTDQMTQQENGFDNIIGTQETIVMEQQSPIIKVKPLMTQRGSGRGVM